MRNFGVTFGADFGSGVWLPPLKRVCEALDLNYTSADSIESLRAILVALSRESEPREPHIVEIYLEENSDQGPSVRTIMLQGRPHTLYLEQISW
jgi:hypothetical protein